MVKPPRPHLVTIHYHSIYIGLQFSLHPFVSALLNAFQVTPYQFTLNAHRLITCFLIRCREVKVSSSLALFLRLFSIGHTDSILHFSPVHHHTIFAGLPSLKNQKEKFLYVSYTDDITLLGFTNTWSSHIAQYTRVPTQNQIPIWIWCALEGLLIIACTAIPSTSTNSARGPFLLVSAHDPFLFFSYIYIYFTNLSKYIYTKSLIH